MNLNQQQLPSEGGDGGSSTARLLQFARAHTLTLSRGEGRGRRILPRLQAGVQKQTDVFKPFGEDGPRFGFRRGRQ